MPSPPQTLSKIALCVTEDWFVLSHFKPLIRALRKSANQVVVITRDNGRIGEIAALGVTTRAFDFDRGTANPLQMLTMAQRLRQVLKDEQCDGVHLVAHKPMALGALALILLPPMPAGLHLTGLGQLAEPQTATQKAARTIWMKTIAMALRRSNTRVFIENDDDLDVLRREAFDMGDRVTLLGGAGIDPDHFTDQPMPDGPIIAAFVGRLIRSKGLEHIVSAMRLVKARRDVAPLMLYGPLDTAHHESFTLAEIRGWESEGLVQWHGQIDDVRPVWQSASIFVLASRREGLPRAMLEAAASGRALIMTDVPGCRRFLRDDVEGFLVPRNDPEQFALALERLITNRALCAEMGRAARARVIDGFTESAVEAQLASGWQALSNTAESSDATR